MRSGLLAQKLGMTQIYDESGAVRAVTLLHVKDCQVTQVKTSDKEGYNAVQLGIINSEKNVKRPQKGHFAKANVPSKRHLAEFRIDAGNKLHVGDELSVNHFVKGQYIDAVSYSIGKGFAGVVKRYHFGGMEASHGVSLTHRSHGSTGMRQDPGKVNKGKKMAGHMGDRRVTMHNLEIVLIDEEKSLIAVDGSVPGSKGSVVLLKDAAKRARPLTAPLPAGLKKKESASKEVSTEASEVQNENNSDQQ